MDKEELIILVISGEADLHEEGGDRVEGTG